MLKPIKLDSTYGKLLALALMCLCLLLSVQVVRAQAQASAGYDHAATSFPLLGSHEAVRCETCHIKGIFKGTPKVCSECHLPGNQRDAVAMTSKHIPITTGCESCHNVSSFGAVQFNHSMVNTNTCANCHDGVRTRGLSATHIPIGNISCGACHSTVAFIPVPLFDHGLLKGMSPAPGCASCHNGITAKGMPANHLPRSSPAQCASCHIASTAVYTSFAGGQMDHTGLTSGCADCHGPSVVAGQFAGITSIVVMPPTSPAGPGSHIPSSITCESCHIGSLPTGLVAANAALTPPGSGFATPAPSGAQIHAGVTGGCSSCHETSMVWMGMSAYPVSPATLVAKAQYRGFQLRPMTVASSYTVADADHPTTGDCSQCHAGTSYFAGDGAKPLNHIPTAANASCTACHTVPGDWAAMPTQANIHANAPSTTGNCAQCHSASAAAAMAIPAANFKIVGFPSDHLPTSAACETCHVGSGSSVATTPVGNGAKFSGSLMSHTGITSNCADCHGPSITGASFVGVSKIVVMPPTSPMGANAHIPSGPTCEACHLASTPAGMVPAAASKTAPGTLFATPAPTTTQIHSGITGGCNSCHEAGYVWMGMSAYPIAPSVLTATAGQQYTGFQTRPKAAAGTYNVADANHPSGFDCAQCHSNTNYFSGQDKPANHIPTLSTAQCTACHTTPGDYATLPTLANIHANAPSTSSNCAQCHGAAASSFAIPAANFSIVGLPGNHLPTSGACETCHVGAGSSIAATPVGNGAKFSGSLMNHTGITSNCAACHGPGITGSSFVGVSQIVAMPPTSPMGTSSHIPSSTVCETCHLGSTPTGAMAASSSKTAPGTLFATPVPTTSQIHSGITGGCNSCHEAANVWMGMSAYPIAPTVLSTGAQYTGFQTRPKSASTYSVADPAHPDAGDCSQCHTGTNYFEGAIKPANHIPTATAIQCSACHTTPGDWATMPTLANIHANAPSTSSNCAQCHSASAAAGMAIPAANFSIVGFPSNHLPTAAACESCHVGAGSSIAATPVGNGAKFSGSLMSHSGITSNCADCHGSGVTGSSFVGVTQIVVMPPTSPMGASSHIPSGSTCEACHLASTPTGLVPASSSKTAPGTLFATPAPTTTQIHTGITGGCSSCHDTGYVWMGVGAYAIAPTVKTTGAQYTGFQTRPKTAIGPYNVADATHPGAGDCSQCHSGISYFTGQDKPGNHIPTATTAQCSACHTTPGDYASPPTLANIHANAPSTTSNCAQCHGATAASFAIPAANFSIVGLPGNHIPTSGACETCHVGAGSSIAATPVGTGAKFSGSLMSHSGIASNCADCHGPSITGTSFVGVSKIVVMPATSPMGPTSHIPSGTSCESCHLATTPAGLIPASSSKTAPGTLFATPAPTTTQIHSGITGACNSCHETSYVWMGMSAYAIAPTVKTTGAQYTGFQTRPKTAAGTYNVADATHPGAGDCSQCHSGTNYFSGQDKPANHIPTLSTAQCTACHTTPGDYATLPTLANIHANAPSTSSNCAQCHGAAASSFAIPAANFSIVGLPGNHLPTSGACETCHVGAGSSIAATPVGNGAKFSGSLMNHTGITSNCAACHGPGITGSSFVGVSQIVAMPPTSPMGTSSHIPSSTVCETCHLGSTPTGVMAASSSKTAPGTLFATPVPTTTQIHSGITGGCNSCHETNYVWMGMSVYPIAPTVMTNGAQYTGFHTRPKTAASTFSVADPAHPGTGDCSQCHSNLNYFLSPDKPANHIPTLSTAQCSACHTSTDFAAMPTLANIHANAPSTSANCAQCHSASAAASMAIPAANFTIVGFPSNHLPTSAACESCHVGAGSSIATTPVGNGAKFSGSLMSHAGITSNCAACHGPGITGSSFVGVAQIVVLPPTSPVGVSSHIPSSTVCENCHLATTPTGMVAASSSKTAPGTLFATPAPTTTQIHTGITGGCSSCHDTGYVWMGMSMSAYAIAPTVKTTGAQYTGFQTRPKTAAGTYNVADATHPSAGDCSQCHSGTNYFTGQDKPANHIPTAATAQCSACHTTPGDYAALPTLANIHANAPSTTGNCAQCHGAAAASFAIPAANFAIVGLPGNHLPTSASCETCHVGAGSSIAATPVGNGAKFSGSLMSHAGITSNCVACHGAGITGSSFVGVNQIVVMPATTPMSASAHIPSSTVCESCHLTTTPAGMVAASSSKTAPGTLFASPAPTTAQIHSGITGGCNSCHDTGYVWMGMSMSAYAIAPTVVTATVGQKYTGFQTRPKTAASTYNVADSAHPATGDCSQCHSGTDYFLGEIKPANHIPYATTALCTACHTSTDYSVLPTLANIHANAQSTTTNCAQCHAANVVAGFAIPAANFTIVGYPSNHVPTAAACESCHVGTGSSVATTPVPNGAKFSGSLMSHAGITSNCAACHGPGITGTTFVGVTKMIVMPPTTPVGVNSHIPSSTTCESCHLGTTPTGMVAANSSKTAPGTLFLTPAPTTAQIHSGITSGCNNCHDTGYVWMSMNVYPIAPTVMGTAATQYTGFHTRPVTAASTFSVADPAHPTGDCSQCHSGTDYFSGAAKPTGHIPTTLACATCHIVAGDYSIAGLASNTVLHTGISTGCISCHTAGTGAGPFAGCTTQATCASPVAVTYQPKVMPLAAGGSATAPSPSTHIPAAGIACEKCHAPAVFTTFANTVMKGSSTMHTAVATTTPTCIGCHEGTPLFSWYGATATSTTPLVTRAVGHQGRKTGQDCISCHSKSYTKFTGAAARVRPVMRAAANGMNQSFLPGVGLTSGLDGAGPFSHSGVAPGQCQSCHNGQLAKGVPAKHLQTPMSCDSCHRTTAWKPAQFSHQGVLPGQCQSCHNAAAATGKPAGHFVTARSCDACHRNVAWVPVLYSHVSPLYQPQADKGSCLSCHVTNGELIPRQMRGNNRPKPVPVHTGP